MSLDRLLSARIDGRTPHIDEPIAAVPAPIPFNEAQRLASLRSYYVLDTAAEQAYDELASIAAAVCRTPIALITLVDRDRQWFKARHGHDVRQTSRDESFCAHAVLHPDETFVLGDTLKDSRFRNHPMVRGQPGVRFYAGAPLVSPDGMAIGTICVLDRRPRQLLESERNALESRARQVVAQLQLRQVTADQRMLNMTDGLTGAWNRRAFDRRLREEWSRHARAQSPLSMLMVDVDHFKAYNEQYGPQAGDSALQLLVRLAERTLRSSDFLARYWGQRLVVLLPDATAAGAVPAAEKLRHAIANESLSAGRLTASIGTASLMPGDAADPHTLVARADRALYVAKQRGRNRVETFTGWD